MSEHLLQCRMIAWATYNEKNCLPLQNLFAIPNGIHTSKRGGIKAKKEGLKRGVPDLFLAVPSGSFHGLYIEVKYGSNNLSIYQQRWKKKLKDQNYHYITCYTLIQFVVEILNYLQASYKITITKNYEITKCEQRKNLAHTVFIS